MAGGSSYPVASYMAAPNPYTPGAVERGWGGD